ncbi:heavy metal translocating P-type ATPase [Helicobacter sp. MIT 05-5293]|uniref:heavy metal translocating P-type ATPase n=1 Tax=Helicobacter sp. MIT 05-5293 TaxID=1548149 RepID=UPI00051D78DC|nr:heavy metal translocating P-type ATPase [Helicobacter sp. MIT 05-5293]
MSDSTQCKCSHCQLLYNKSQLKEVSNPQGERLYFCCNGCESVYFLLHQAHLDSFYDKLNTPLSPPIAQENQDLARFDTAGFHQKYVTSLADKNTPTLCEVHLILSGIHCAACIWLNENILLQQEGIQQVHINYTNNKATIVWDHSKLALSEIIALIRSIGYDAYPYDARLQESQDKKQMNEYYIRVIVALFCTMNIMWVAIAQYSGYFLGIDENAKDILNLASFILCTPALFYSGFVFFRSSYYGLKNGFIGMDLLVAVGSTLTYCYSIYAAITHSGETYFESVSMIITFVLIGKFLEVRARKNAGDSLDKLTHFLPTSVQVCEQDNPNQVRTKSPEEVQVGDVLLVLAGEKIAIDGVLLSQNALFDTKAISGESLPIEQKSGDEVLSGYVNLHHQIYYRATKAFSQSLMSHIISIVSSSLSYRPHIQNLANSISQYFSRTILTIALLGFLSWIFIGEVSIERALMISISVIIIACPCALALATPIATVVGIGESYKHNVLFKQAQFLETLAKSHLVVFDKTGTLTQGEPKVQKTHLYAQYDRSLLLAFVRLSKHPVAEGIKEYLDEQCAQESHNCESHTEYTLSDFTQFDAQGIQAQVIINGQTKTLFGGNLTFLSSQDIALPKLDLGDCMVFGFGIKDTDSQKSELLEIITLKDKLKDDAKMLIESLHSQGIKTALLSGDRQESVAEIAQMLDIKDYYFALSPLQKNEWIQSYKAAHPDEIVVMVGDGINDAPALSQSDIAISMGAGSDIAILSSDVVILDDQLSTLNRAFILARKTFSTIKQNILLSIIYNALTIPLALCGLIIPLIAALSMSLSSLIVVLNSLRLKRADI